MKKTVVHVAALLCAAVLILAGCGGNDGSGGSGGAAGGGGASTPGPTGPVTYAVSVTVSGLDASGLVLQDNGGDALNVAADGVSTFATHLAPGAAYSVSVATQPGGTSQFCSVANGSGTMGTSDVTNVTVTCKDVAHFAYVPNSDNTVSIYTVDPVTGALKSAGAPQVLGTAGSTFDAVAVDPAGKFVFLVDTTRNALLSAKIDRATGALAAAGGIAIAGTPQALAISPNGKFIYVANLSGELGAFMVASDGTLSSNPGFTAFTPPGATSMTIDANGKFLYLTSAFTPADVEIYELDPVKGTLLSAPGVFGAFASTAQLQSMALLPNGFAYVVDSFSKTVDVIPMGSKTITGQVPTGNNPFNLTMDAYNRFLYVPDAGENRISVYQADPQTGGLTVGKDFITSTPPLAIAADPTGRFVYTTNPVARTVSAFSIDGATGALTKVGGDLSTGAGGPAIALTK
jgi:DNA-binding beta-propeller fold protein YncE